MTRLLLLLALLWAAPASAQIVFTDVERNNAASFFFEGTPDAQSSANPLPTITLSNSTDVPSDNGGNQALQVNVATGGDGGYVAFFGRQPGDEMGVDAVDISGLADPYISFYYKATSTAAFDLVYEIQEDADNDEVFTRAEDGGDEDRFRNSVAITGAMSDYMLVSVPVSSLNDANANMGTTGGDGVFSDIVAAVAFEINNAPANETIELLVDYIVFTDGILPVELTTFTASANGSDALLRWATASETNNTGFEVEMDRGAGFTQIGWVDGAGTTLEAQAYSFPVRGLEAGSYRFRLKQIDLDGSPNLSPVVELTIGLEAAELTAAQPNPASGMVSLSLATVRGERVDAGLYDALGRRVATLFDGTTLPGERVTLRTDASALPSGVYFVRAQGETFVQSRQIVVAR